MLESLFPPQQEQLRPLRGREVCVIMNDGARHTGILTSCGKSSLVLNGLAVNWNSAPAAKAVPGRKRSQRPIGRKRKANVQSGASPAIEGDGEAFFWGDLSMAPSTEYTSSRIVLPLRTVEAVLLL